jgi:hypothetical protein
MVIYWTTFVHLLIGRNSAPADAFLPTDLLVHLLQTTAACIHRDRKHHNHANLSLVAWDLLTIVPMGLDFCVYKLR